METRPFAVFNASKEMGGQRHSNRIRSPGHSDPHFFSSASKRLREDRAVRRLSVSDTPVIPVLANDA